VSGLCGAAPRKAQRRRNAYEMGHASVPPVDILVSSVCSEFGWQQRTGRRATFSSRKASSVPSSVPSSARGALQRPSEPAPNACARHEELEPSAMPARPASSASQAAEFFKGVTDMLKKATPELPSPVLLAVSRDDAQVRRSSAGISGSPQPQRSDEFVV